MKLFFFRDVVANFGDELNPWLFSRLLPDVLDDDESELFLGVGSILYANYPAQTRKIVFGSGYGGYGGIPPVLDDTWKIYFVRGPRTAEALGIDRAFGIGDAATLIRLIDDMLPKAGPSIGAAFMPHWESAIDGVWDRAAADAGLAYIDPRWSVERVITAIRSSSLVVSEAMHGAIVADALRVPWVPFLPLLQKHRNKWFDWAESLDLRLTFAESSPSSWNEWAVQQLRNDLRSRKSIGMVAPAATLADVAPPPRSSGMLGKARSMARSYNSFGGSFARSSAVRALTRAAAAEPHLSRDSVVARATEQMEGKLAALRDDMTVKR